jgi:LL-diaminopimelate aminotransferase
MKPATRLSSLPPYPFARLEKRIGELRAKGTDVIRLDIGNPDLAPTSQVVETLSKSAANERNHGYPGFAGTPQLREAIASYYLTRFGVDIDASKEVLPLIGSKEGIVNMALAFIDPGDVALVPNPGYPAYSMGTLMAGGVVYDLPLLRDRGFLPDLASIPANVLKKAKLMWLNYPNNPTTAIAPMSFLQESVDFARKHDVLLCFDNPYYELVYDGYTDHTIFEIPGAKDVTVEFNSLSKTYNMAGWRIGMAVGQAAAISALAQLKSNVDSGVFVPIQQAAAAALTNDQEWLKGRNAIYQGRRDMILSALPRLGLTADRSPATLYVWARLPDGYPSADYATRLLDTAGVSLAPGVFFGSYGEGYVRMSLGTPTERLAEALQRMEKADL